MCVIVLMGCTSEALNVLVHAFGLSTPWPPSFSVLQSSSPAPNIEICVSAWCVFHILALHYGQTGTLCTKLCHAVRCVLKYVMLCKFRHYLEWRWPPDIRDCLLLRCSCCVLFVLFLQSSGLGKVEEITYKEVAACPGEDFRRNLKTTEALPDVSFIGPEVR